MIQLAPIKDQQRYDLGNTTMSKRILWYDESTAEKKLQRFGH